MSIYKGSTKLKNLYVGGTKIGKVYKGSTLVYSSSGGQITIPIYQVVKKIVGGVLRRHVTGVSCGNPTEGYNAGYMLSTREHSYPGVRTDLTLSSISGVLGEQSSSMVSSDNVAGTYQDTITDANGLKWHRYLAGDVFFHLSPKQLVNDHILVAGGGTISGTTFTYIPGSPSIKVREINMQELVDNIIYRF